MPVEVTTIVPAPRVTWVFMNARSTRSPRAASAATASSCLGTGALSPVSADSSISRVAARMIRPSAGTRSPASTITMSPGTSSLHVGDLDDLAVAADPALTTIIFWSAATLASALPSWLRPRKALKQRQQDQQDAGHELAGQEQADDAGDEQHDLHRVAVLAQEAPASAAPSAASANLLAPYWRAARLDLGVGQPGLRIDRLALEGVLDASARARPSWPSRRVPFQPCRDLHVASCC